MIRLRAILLSTSVFFMLISCTSAASITPQQPSTTTSPTFLPIPSDIAPTSDEILQICPDKHLVDKSIPLEGSLFYLEYPSQNILSFPDLEKSEILKERIFTDGDISPNSHYLVTASTLYNAEGNYSGDYLDILNYRGDIISSTHWKGEWTGNPIWLNNDEVVLQAPQENILTIYNPFSGTGYSKTFNFPNEENVRIVTADPIFKIVAYIYSTYSNTNNFGLNSLRVWDEEEKREILDLKDEFSSIVSDIHLSNDKEKMAITTVTPNEMQNHSEIILIDIENGTPTQISDFRAYFDEILITGIQWSFDDQAIYFWAIIDENTENGVDLFSIDLRTKQITHYCFQGRLGSENLIVWVPNASEFYFVSDSTSFASPDNSSKDEWDILLVNSVNNKAYKVSENITLIGWLTRK